MLPIAKSRDLCSCSIAEIEAVIHRWARKKAASSVLNYKWGDLDRTNQEEWKTSSFFTSIVVPLYFREPCVIQMPVRCWKTEQLIRKVLQQQSSEEVSSHMTDGIFHFLHLMFWEMTSYFGELGSDFLEKALRINEISAGLHTIIILCWGYTHHVRMGSY